MVLGANEWTEARLPLAIPGERHPVQVTITVPGEHQREGLATLVGAGAAAPASAETQANRELLAAAVREITAVCSLGDSAAVDAACAVRVGLLSDLAGVGPVLRSLPVLTSSLAAAITGQACARTRIPLPPHPLPAAMLAAFK